MTKIHSTDIYGTAIKSLVIDVLNSALPND